MIPILGVFALALMAAIALVPDREERRKYMDKSTKGVSQQAKFAALVPDARAFFAELFLNLRQKHGLEARLGETYRGTEEQAEEEAKGHAATTDPGWHGQRRASDVYLIDPETKKVDYEAKNKKIYGLMHNEAKALGGHVYGYMVIRNKRTGATFTDPYHVEFRGGHTLAELRRTTARRSDRLAAR